ncbi:MAG: uL15 family ribosomal protein [Candidatus Hydrothermarchaeales archaeon]
MARKDRKIHKKRGSRTSGHGHHNKNRGAGNRGGVGMAGTHKGRWTWIVKYKPDHFGRRGFDIPRETKKVYSSINVGTIDEFLPQLIEEGIATKKGKVYEVDLTKTDFFKVLGKGRVTHALSIKAMAFSSGAKEKIGDAGGKITLAGEESE